MYGIWDFSADNGKIQAVKWNSDPVPSVGLFYAASSPAYGLEMIISNYVISYPNWQRQ